VLAYIRSYSKDFNSETSKIAISDKETTGEGYVLVPSKAHYATDKITRSSLLDSVQTESGVHPASYNGYRRVFPWVQRSQGLNLTAYLHLVPKLRMVDLYLNSPIRLHGVVLY
jgi:hypothetical protein